jgi:glycosyltransferase involved in cell wall biosynthesis
VSSEEAHDRTTATDKPEILVLTTSYPAGDEDPSSVFLAKLLGAISKHGYSMKVVAPSDGTFHGRRRVRGIETVRFGYFFPRSLEKLTRGGGGIPENMKRSWLARLQLLTMMPAFFFVALWEGRRSDLIYANWLGAGVIGALVGLITGKPLVVSYRGDDGYLARERFAWWVLARIVSDRAAIVAPVSGELVRIFIDFGVPEEKCRLPRFGVDREMFHPAEERPARGDRVRLLFVGSLIPRKGLQDLLEALASPGLEHVDLVVVGEGYFRGDLEAMCERFGFRDRTEWKGVLPQTEVARIMRTVDLFCLPSHMEGRPNVVNEALASGLAVISTRVGGIPDMIVEGETGLLFDAGNVEELRECLLITASDPEYRERMGAAGREFLDRTGVSWEATAEDFHEIFSELLRRDED